MLPPHSHDSNSHNNSLNNSKRSNTSGRSSGNTKATVHINGIAVDHFQQNSDVDEDRTSIAACQNSDIQGFISYSSDSSMIELNLKFKKCACNENIINISKENLQNQQQQQQQQKEQRNSESSLAIATSFSSAEGLLNESATGCEGASATAATATPFSKEGKSKKLLQLNKDNLNSLVNKLNDTNSSSSSCTKCRLSLDINNILNQIVSDGKVKYATQAKANEPEPMKIVANAIDPVEEECNRTLKVVNKLGSPPKAASWSPLLPSPCSPSPSPSPSVSTDDPNLLQRRHSETVERRSIGTQHGLKSGYRKKHQLRKGKTQVEEIIVISDEFRRQSLSDQTVKIQKAKKYSKSMESIDKQVDEESGKIGGGVFECLHLDEDTLTVVVDSGAPPNGHKKSKSKSVDDISLGSNHNEEEFAPVGMLSNAANSVELVFISNEFVQRKTRTSSDVIIVDANRKSLKRRKSSTKNLIIITDDYKEKSATAQSDVRIVKSSSLKSKDSRRKTTISNSSSFLTYEEPFSPETLESKDIGTLFAEASAADAAACAASNSKSDLNSPYCRPM
ncbi:uncharacterized protein LOC135701073 [Ochlerotatus camptorhynchus]|uniref:uncharacterized protein LOC135701073 n=1 Tax=Ochlerotatus camptorhynchus TaxID=644619 RepID=UPI0031D4E26C